MNTSKQIEEIQTAFEMAMAFALRALENKTPQDIAKLHEKVINAIAGAFGVDPSIFTQYRMMVYKYDGSI